MRACRSIFVITLAFFVISCQTVKRAPVKPTAGQSDTIGGQYSLVPLPESIEKTETPREVIQPLKNEPKKTPEKPPIPPIMGTQPKTGLIAPSEQRIIPRPSPAADKERQKVVLNFDKADISEVTTQIFGDQLKVNYVLDQALQGRISMYIEGEFTNQELLRMVIRAYEANGMSVIPKNGFYFIQASQKASASGLPIANQMLIKTDEQGTRPLIVIYRLRFLDVRQASQLISPFLSPGKKVVTEPTTNSLIFIEDAQHASSIVNLLKTIDINVLQEVSMEIVPLRSISPKDAVQGMEDLMSKLGGGSKENALKSSLAYIPLQNYGGVLVMAHNQEMLKSAKQWLQALDVQGISSGEQINIYFVQNGLAADIADILNQVYGISGPSTSRRLDQQIVPSGRSGNRGSFGTSGSFGSSLSGSTFGSSSSSSSFGSGSSGSLSGSRLGSSSTGGFSGSSSRSRRSVSGGIGGTTGESGKPSIFTGEVTVIADEINNALVIRANPVDYAKIKNTVETLDILPRAVLIEVLIAEVTLTKDLEYGVQYFFQHQPHDPTRFGASLGGLDNPFTTTSTSSSSTTTTTTTNLFPSIGSVASSGLALSWISGAKDFATFLKLISTKANVNILSNPTLLATDNKDATLTVGGRQPVPTGSYSGTTASDLSTATVFSTIQYEETGTIINITPHINAGGLVRLELEGIIRRVGADAIVGANNTAPTFIERNIKTTLLAQSGSTVVIGGIIDSTENKSKSGVPGLQDIPLLGPVFGSHSKSLNKTELIIAITPHVIDQRGTTASREFIEKLQNLKRKITH